MEAPNLVRSCWLPVRRKSGAADVISPAGLVSHYADNPVVAMAWPRPDFDLAALEFLIGLLASSAPFELEERAEWVEAFHEPPSPDELAKWMEAIAAAFDVERFMQDGADLKGEPEPLDYLIMDAPGEKTRVDNADLFIKRSTRAVLSRPAAALALYVHQQYCGSGGAGYRVSIRGGGPLITLAIPDGGRTTTLWERLWLNTLVGMRPGLNSALSFPWLAPTVTSEKGQTVHQVDASPLQAYFGMPRRIRLVWEENTDRMPCAITGAVDDLVCVGFRRQPYGANYGVWRHPTSPYYTPKKDTPPLAVHAKPARLGYRHWVGLVAGGEGRLLATCVLEARNRLIDLGKPWRDNSRLSAAGYAVNKDAAIAFVEAEMPIHTLDPVYRVQIERLAKQSIDAAEVVASALWKALRTATHAEDGTMLAGARERLWVDTEGAFHTLLDASIPTAGPVSEEWRSILQRVALSIFDDNVSPIMDDITRAQDVVEARRNLIWTLTGYGGDGTKLFKILLLEPPAKKSKAKKKEKVA